MIFMKSGGYLAVSFQFCLNAFVDVGFFKVLTNDPKRNSFFAKDHNDVAGFHIFKESAAFIESSTRLFIGIVSFNQTMQVVFCGF